MGDDPNKKGTKLDTWTTTVKPNKKGEFLLSHRKGNISVYQRN